MKSYVFFVNKRKFETEKDELSVQEILVDFAEADPKEHLLALKDGNEIKEFHNLNELITMKNGMHFSLLSKNPTTVS